MATTEVLELAQVPLVAETQYVVVEDKVGEYVSPLLKGDPPVEFAYQLTVPPAEAVALNVTLPVPQRAPGVVSVIVGGEVTDTVRVRSPLSPHPLFATTDISPPALPVVNVIEVVPWPPVIVQLAGLVQV